jgi:hypothetical protein
MGSEDYDAAKVKRKDGVEVHSPKLGTEVDYIGGSEA